MQQLAYDVNDMIPAKKGRLIQVPAYVPEPRKGFGVRTYERPIFSDKETNDYINQQIEKQMKELDEKI